MNIEKTFPLRYYFNVGRADVQRNETEFQLMQAGLTVRRFPMISSQFVRRCRGYGGDKHQYALSLSLRIALRKGRACGSDAVLLLGDENVFAPDFQKLAEDLNLPEDWGMFYFDCVHLKQPEVVSPGMVRVKKAHGTHAMAVKAPYYKQVIEALSGGESPSLNEVMTALQEKIPSYAASPNLIWLNHGQPPEPAESGTDGLWPAEDVASNLP